jgi:hypothetical protein
MRQHQDPEGFHDEDLDGETLDDEFGRPVYQGTGLTVRALTGEQLQRFLDAHQGQPTRLLGSGWAALDPPGHPLGGPRTSPAATLPVPAEPVTGSHGSPGRSALVEYRRSRAEKLTAWNRSLAWRVPLVAAAGLAADALAAQAGLPRAGLVGLAVAAVVGWRLRFRPSEQVTAWRRGARGDGLAWHDHYRLDRTLETVRWEAQVVGRLPGTRAAAMVCVHGAHVHGGGLEVQGVAIVPSHLLRSALGYDQVLSDTDVELLATTAWTSLRPAARRAQRHGQRRAGRPAHGRRR